MGLEAGMTLLGMVQFLLLNLLDPLLSRHEIDIEPLVPDFVKVLILVNRVLLRLLSLDVLALKSHGSLQGLTLQLILVSLLIASQLLLMEDVLGTFLHGYIDCVLPHLLDLFNPVMLPVHKLLGLNHFAILVSLEEVIDCVGGLYTLSALHQGGRHAEASIDHASWRCSRGEGLVGSHGVGLDYVEMAL